MKLIGGIRAAKKRPLITWPLLAIAAFFLLSSVLDCYGMRMKRWVYVCFSLTAGICLITGLCLEFSRRREGRREKVRRIFLKKPLNVLLLVIAVSMATVFIGYTGWYVIMCLGRGKGLHCVCGRIPESFCGLLRGHKLFLQGK